MGVAALFLALGTIAVGMRCYCRLVVVRSFGLDDYFAVIAWILYVFFATFVISGVHHGTGQHAADLPLAEIPVGLKWWWACEPVYVLCNMALKFSIGIFLLRIAVARTHRMIVWTVIVVTEVYGLAYFLLFVLQCLPSDYFWTQYTGGSGKCINPLITVNATYVYSAISCWADWTLGIIPIFLVWNLQMNPRTKFLVALILAMGGIASTATIIRIPYVKNLKNLSDFLYATSDVAIWSTAETGLGMVASNLATLRPLLRTFLERSRLFGSSSGGQSKGWTPSSSGYIKSKTKGTYNNDEIALRNDVGKQAGVTTVIESDLEKGEKGKPNGGWNTTSESKLTESSEEERAWGSGIRKTTVQIQQTSL